jgi:hypothetical protein
MAVPWTTLCIRYQEETETESDNCWSPKGRVLENLAFELGPSSTAI